MLQRRLTPTPSTSPTARSSSAPSDTAAGRPWVSPAYVAGTRISVVYDAVHRHGSLLVALSIRHLLRRRPPGVE